MPSALGAVPGCGPETCLRRLDRADLAELGPWLVLSFRDGGAADA
ncbi:MAG TPA: hypothetical protein VFH47_06910 [Candidatus Thermoplasmatota archaeon]|nr:hypothetical protein [Candidatus Thermoplasmatota archaeon]